MASFNGPKLTNPIRTDVPETQEVLVALAKQDPTPISDIPVGAKRLYEASSGKWQWQLYNGTSWAPVPFLQHNVDQLDGYHAAITPTANTVAVRNASGVLEDSITGNAATATSATTLSETLPVNKGGTGATTSAAARTNLGVPPTSHASSGTAYGLGSNLNYGHVRGDGETTDVIAGEIVVKDVLFNNSISLTSSGLLGKARYIGGSSKFNIDTEDFDVLIINTSSNTGTNPPGVSGWLLIRQYFYERTSDQSNNSRKQVAFGFYSNKIFTRHFRSGGEWYPWVKVVNETDLATSSTPGIVKPGTGITVDAAGALNVTLNNTVTSTSTTQAATANAVKTAYDKAVEAHSAVRQVQAEVSTKLDDSTVHVIETWKSADGTSWYRKWSDGFIEQGGTIVASSSDTDKTCTFATPFSKQKSIRVFCTCDGNLQDGGMWMSVFNPWGITTTSFNIRLKANLKTTYYACGY